MKSGFSRLFFIFCSLLAFIFGKAQTPASVNGVTDKADVRNARYIDSLQEALQKKASQGQPDDSLLDVYINTLPEDSFSSPNTLRFIAQMSPLLDSKANTVLRRDPELFTKVWMSLPLQERVHINGLIINRSMVKAVEQKNESFASFIAAFARSTYNINTIAAGKAYELNMLRFYERTGDTAKYFPKAIAYYNGYYMNLDTDSLLREDSLARLRVMARAIRKDTIVNGKPVKVASIIFAPPAQRIANDLTHAAWSFYEMTNNPELLRTATRWVEKALAIYTSPDDLNTYAHLLYIQQQKDKAITIQTLANQLRSQHGQLPKEWDWDLDRMKRGMTLKGL